MPNHFNVPVIVLWATSALLLGGESRESFAITGSESIRIGRDGWSVLDGAGMRFTGMSRRASFETPPPAGRASYFVGKDPRGWVRGAPTYERVRERNVYSGIDVVYYGKNGAIEYDLEIAPRGDVRRVGLIWIGSDLPRIDPDGSLVLSTNMKLSPPSAYQMSGRRRVAVPCGFELHGRLVNYRVGDYDRSRTLVIDPKILFTSLTAGYSEDLAADADGNSYAVTSAYRVPTLGAYQSPFGGASITKRDRNGKTLWVASIGLAAPTTPVHVAVDGSGNVILASVDGGSPYVSTDDGKSWHALQLPRLGIFGPACCVVDPADSQHFLIGSLSNSSSGSGIVETHDGGASFQTIDQQADVPLAFDPRMPGVIYGFNNSVAGAAVGYYRLLHPFIKSDDGGRTWRRPNSGAGIPINQIAVDPSGSGRVYAFGEVGIYRSDDRGESWTHLSGQLGNAPLYIGSAAFGAADSFFGVAYSKGDGYLAKVDPTGALVFSTLIGGRNMDKVYSIAIAQNGDILIGGTTQSDDLLASVGAPVHTNGAYEQGFLARLSADGSALLGFRYVGGSTTDSIFSIALLSSGEVVVGGGSDSPDFPDVTSDAFVPQCCGGFLGVYSGAAFGPRFFTFLGDYAVSAMATAGMLAYFGTAVFDPNAAFLGAPLVCEDNQGFQCSAVLGAVDLAPGAMTQDQAGPAGKHSYGSAKHRY